MALGLGAVAFISMWSSSKAKFWAQKYDIPFLPQEFNSVQSLSHVQLFVTPLTTAHQASLSITNSQSWSIASLFFLLSFPRYSGFLPVFVPFLPANENFCSFGRWGDYIWADLGSGCCSTILTSMQETLSQESSWSSLWGPGGDPEGKVCRRVRTF